MNSRENLLLSVCRTLIKTQAEKELLQLRVRYLEALIIPKTSTIIQNLYTKQDLRNST